MRVLRKADEGGKVNAFRFEARRGRGSFILAFVLRKQPAAGDVGGTASCGVVTEPFLRVLPQQPFALRLQCPPGGSSCSGSLERLGSCSQ